MQTTAFLHFSARFSGNHYNVANWKIATINQAMQATSIMLIGPKRLESRERVNWNWDHEFQTIVQIKKQVHKANMETYQNDDYKAYGWCSLLATDEWNTYIKDPLNENARLAFIAKMTDKEKFPENTSPPYGIFYKSMTVTEKNRKRTQTGRSKALEWI
jgi:hypothetical protein